MRLPEQMILIPVNSWQLIPTTGSKRLSSLHRVNGFNVLLQVLQKEFVFHTVLPDIFPTGRVGSFH